MPDKFFRYFCRQIIPQACYESSFKKGYVNRMRYNQIVLGMKTLVNFCWCRPRKELHDRRFRNKHKMRNILWIFLWNLNFNAKAAKWKITWWITSRRSRPSSGSFENKKIRYRMNSDLSSYWNWNNLLVRQNWIRNLIITDITYGKEIRIQWLDPKKFKISAESFRARRNFMICDYINPVKPDSSGYMRKWGTQTACRINFYIKALQNFVNH